MGNRIDIGKRLPSPSYLTGLPDGVAERAQRVVRAVGWIRDLNYKPGVHLTYTAVIDAFHELTQATDALGEDWLVLLDMQTLVDGAVKLVEGMVKESVLPDWAA